MDKSDISTQLEEIKEGLETITGKVIEIQQTIGILEKEKRISGQTIRQQLTAVQVIITGMKDMVKAVTDNTLKLKYDVYQGVDMEPLALYDILYDDLHKQQEDVDADNAAFLTVLEGVVAQRDTIQRMVDFSVLVRKIQEEIENREKKIESLKKRIKSGKSENTNEITNAKFLRKKNADAIAILTNRRALVLDYYFAVRRQAIRAAVATLTKIETGLDRDSHFYKVEIPVASTKYPIDAALRVLTEMTARHVDSKNKKLNEEIGTMTELQRRKAMAGLG